MKKQTLLLSVALALGIAAPASASQITVQKGDSMYLIAKRYNVPFSLVLKYNSQYKNPDLIHPGDKIEIPTGTTGTNTNEGSRNDNIPQGNASAIAGSVDAKIHEVVRLVNAERAKQGLQSLKLSTKISDIATLKAQDMADKKYFSHTSPTYGTPFEMLQKYGVHYKAAGENIAAGQRSPQEVMKSWLNSSGHRANILNANYTEIGVGYYAGGSYGTYWVQMFVKE